MTGATIYMRWSDAADKFISDLYMNCPRLTVQQITNRLNLEMEPARSYSSVSSRLVMLGFSDRAAPDWPEDRTAKLKRLWAERLTAAEIAAELGVSRSSVLGKVHRLHLDPRAPRGVEPRKAKTARPVVRPPREGFPLSRSASSNASKISNAGRSQIPVAPQLTSAELRRLLADAVRNTAAMQIEEPL